MFRRLHVKDFIFILIGLGIVIAGIVLLVVQSSLNSGTVSRTAYITDIVETGSGDDVSYTVYIEYEFEGVSYEAELRYHTSGMREGDAVTIRLNPERPEKPVTGGLDVAGWVLTGFGALFTAFGAWMLLGGKNSPFRRRRLIRDGMSCAADITGVLQNGSVVINGKSPYILTCYPRPGAPVAPQELTSGDIWYDPAPVLERFGITGVTVYFDRQDPTKYIVDLDELDARHREMPAADAAGGERPS